MSKHLRGRPLAVILTAAGLAVVAAPAAAETLADAIAAAYGSNPTIQAQRATQRALDETYVQARAGWRPTLNLGGSWQYGVIATPRLVAIEQGAIDRNQDGIPDGAGYSDSTSTRAALNFSQPLWTGGRVASAVSAAQAEILAGRENLRRVESQVIGQVVQAYVDVRRDTEALRIRQQNVEVLRRQLDESNARFEVGEITRTDVALSQARLAAAQAQLQSTEAQLGNSRASYAAVVGRPPADLQPEPSLAYMMPATVDEAFTAAQEFNPQLRAQQFAEQASRARVSGARAERMPNVTAQASLDFTNRVREDVWERDFYSRGSTVGVNVTVPLFAGGQISSRIRQSVERNNADRINIETQRRTVVQQVAQSWNQLTAARANIVSSAEQVRAAEIAAEGTRQEQQVGLRTTIDVLNAEQELRQAQLAVVTSRRDEYVAAASVLSAMGRLDARNLIPSEPQYDPARNFRKLRITWGWVPWEEPIGIIDRLLAVPPIAQPHQKALEPNIGPGLQPPPVAAATSR
ncbi:TolC family outer membrane protein [Phenylobacterium sp.]|jgi:outer membrane protein|uniref:TolC family outer membrane protein n=1 Tax=Phenylobacterium sp. TaxID=1871053 RepID=UPI0037837817